MLEGLGICEKKLSEVKIDNQTFRFDSEFFSIQYLEILRMLNRLVTEKLETVTTWITQGPNPIFTEEGTIPCLTGRNINQGRVIYENADFVSEQEYNNLSRFQLEQGDTLITLKGKGSIGKIGFVTEKKNAIISRNIGIVRPNKEINAAYLNAYILSKFGQNMVLRGETGGTGQSTLTCSYLKSLDIPRMENEDVIGNLVWQSEKVFQSAKLSYSEAENYLLECLGMANFAANSGAYNIKTLKESFLETGRFDSEYYLPKYEDYIKLVCSYPNGYDLIGNVCDIKDSNFSPINGVKYKYIELANIGKSGEITGCDVQDGEYLPTRARRLVYQGDVIVSSIEGSLDSCALITDEYDGALCSTGFYVLKSHQHNPETLLTLFKSLPIQNLMKKGCSGTILTAIGKSEVEKIPIPLIRKEVQEEIAKHVQKSFDLRKEALQLLENAKLTVENIIERGGNLLTYNKLQFGAFEEWNHAVWLLFTEIGITSNIDVKAPIGSTYKKLSDSFLKSGRLDAEYYQPKYDYLFSELKRFKTKTIRQIATLSKSIEPGSDAYCEKGIPFIRVADLSKFGLSEPAVYLSELEFKDSIRPQKDTILLSKDGSVGIAYKVDEPVDVITSGAIIHLNITDKEVLPDYLTLVLNSAIVKLQAERDAGGSIIQHWKPSEIEKVIIPILPMANQIKISEMLQQSFSLRKESKCLLQEAIQIVETAIEEN